MGKGFRYAALVLAVMSLFFSGCAKFKQIRPVSAAVESIMPSGLRSAVVTIGVEIDNPAAQLTLSDIEGQLSRSGKVLGRVALDPFILKAKTLEKYHLRATVTLDQNASLLDLMALTREEALDECLVDIYFKVSLKGGISKKRALEQLPLRSLMKM